jgi:hypothetical protein
MGRRDLIIGILVFIVFMLLTQRAVSQYRCEEGEIQKEGKCESDSYKTKWWAFWESPKCKRGELQADYTCLASMIMDAVSPGAVYSPQAAAAPAAVDTLQYFNRMVDFVERNFLTMNNDVNQSQDFTVNIAISNGCPIQNGAKARLAVTIKQSFDQQATKDFQNMLNDFYKALINNGAATPLAERNAINQVIVNTATTEGLMSIVSKTFDTQSRTINIIECGADAPLRLDQHLVASIIVGNILTHIGGETRKLLG